MLRGGPHRTPISHRIIWFLQVKLIICNHLISKVIFLEIFILQYVFLSFPLNQLNRFSWFSKIRLFLFCIVNNICFGECQRLTRTNLGQKDVFQNPMFFVNIIVLHSRSVIIQKCYYAHRRSSYKGSPELEGNSISPPTSLVLRHAFNHQQSWSSTTVDIS